MIFEPTTLAWRVVTGDLHVCVGVCVCVCLYGWVCHVYDQCVFVCVPDQEGIDLRFTHGLVELHFAVVGHLVVGSWSYLKLTVRILRDEQTPTRPEGSGHNSLEKERLGHLGLGSSEPLHVVAVPTGDKQDRRDGIVALLQNKHLEPLPSRLGCRRQSRAGRNAVSIHW